jgi:AcrR family transcriptional regulator
MARAQAAKTRSRTSAAPAPPPIRERLVDLAAEVFATEGYASASVRDLARRLDVTSGAIYGNFRGKADLLAAAVDARLTSDMWTLPDEVAAQSLSEVVAYQFGHYKSREQLMSLVLEGALAARGDAEVLQRLHDTLGERLTAASRAFKSRREAEGFDPAVNLDAAVKMLWSIEIGMRVLAALGLASPTQKDCADVVAHFMQGLQAKPVAARAAKPAKAAAKQPAKKAAAAKKASPRKRGA